MSENRKFVVTKDAKTESITYMEYTNLKGFNVKPKKSLKIEDMINVNEMVIINPSLIEKLIDKKSERMLNKFFAMLSVIEDDSDDSDTGYMLILDEVERFKSLVTSKYQDYMKKEKYKILIQKIKIIEEEIKRRKESYNLYYDEPEVKATNKPRR